MQTGEDDYFGEREGDVLPESGGSNIFIEIVDLK
jgi:hypothetical protein